MPFPAERATSSLTGPGPSGCIAPAASTPPSTSSQGDGGDRLEDALAADAAARWTNAEFSETVENGPRTFYATEEGDSFYRQKPVMVTLHAATTAAPVWISALRPLRCRKTRGRWRHGRPAETNPDQDRPGPRQRKLDPARALCRRDRKCRPCLHSIAASLPRGAGGGDQRRRVAADKVAMNFTYAEETGLLKAQPQIRFHDDRLVSN